jgi:hypothetical protein
MDEPKATRHRASFSPGTLCGVIVWAVACRSPSQFATNFAPDFQLTHHKVSVFGVYKDGQMSSDAWGGLAPRIEPLLGGAPCDVAYDSKLVMSNAALASAIADYARESGPGDDLLAQMRPAAQGDLIVVFTASGRLPVEAKTTVNDPTPPAAGMGGKGFATISSKPKGGEDKSVLQLSASFFSVSQGHSVGLVQLLYSGESVDEAMAQFAAKVSQALPGGTCSGWNWSAQIDPERIRALGH